MTKTLPRHKLRKNTFKTIYRESLVRYYENLDFTWRDVVGEGVQNLDNLGGNVVYKFKSALCLFTTLLRVRTPSLKEFGI